jgi:hypothetical protein
MYTFRRVKIVDFKGLAEVINKFIFNNLHNPPPTKHFDKIINLEGGHYEVEENIGNNLGFKANKNLSILYNTVFSNYI